MDSSTTWRTDTCANWQDPSGGEEGGKGVGLMGTAAVCVRNKVFAVQLIGPLMEGMGDLSPSSHIVINVATCTQLCAAVAPAFPPVCGPPAGTCLPGCWCLQR